MTYKSKNQLISRKSFLKSSVMAGAFLGLNAPSAWSYTNYQTDLEPTKLRFLFQGDSITDGNRGRNEDPNHIMGHGYAFSVASRIGADFPESGFSFFNRGISGDTVDDLDRRWKTDTLDLKPDVLSLLVGINDVGNIVRRWEEPGTLDEFEGVYRKLLNRCTDQNPNILFVLGLPFVYPVGSRKEKWELWSTQTLARAKVVRNIAKDYNAVCVDYPNVFEKALKRAPIDYWIWDGVHPTVFGHELMAREWIIKVADRLDFLKHYV
jgi:lysophospholipase L1-like esterase